MNKLMIFAASAAAVLAVGCAKNEVFQTPPAEEAVTFGVYAGNAATKTTAITTDNLSTFGVYASYTTADWTTSNTMNFMFDQSVSGSHASGFTYSPVKYWPNETTDKLSFWAYAPYLTGTNGIAESTTNSDSGYPKISYTLPTDANQVDLLWATPQMNKVNNSAYTSGTSNPSAGDATVGNKVTFVFKHALALLDVQARYLVDVINAGNTVGSTIDASTTITINSITLSGSFPASGILNLNDGTWSSQGENTATVFSRDFSPAKNVTNENASIIAASEQMMVIPKSSGTTTVTVQVDYDITTTDAKLAGGKVVINNVLSSSADLTITGGNKYNLILVLGITSVKLDVSVEDWPVAAGSAEVNLPLND